MIFGVIVYSEICKEKGLYFSQENGLLKCKGKLSGGRFTVKEDLYANSSF